MNYSDRFIPRPLDYFSFANHDYSPENSMNIANSNYSQMIYEACTGSKAPPKTILAYKSRDSRPVLESESIQESYRSTPQTFKVRRPISQDRVLSAEILDFDFYHTVLDTTSSGDLVVSLFDKLYCRQSNGTIYQIPDPTCDSPHSLVHRIKKTNLLLSGHTSSIFAFIDLETQSAICSGKTSQEETLICAESTDKDTLFAGTRQGRIIQIDNRVNTATTIGLHTLSQETEDGPPSVPGLAYNPLTGLIASGGDDNAVHIWDPRMPNKKITSITSHTAAVRALKWLPQNRYMLLSGGGTADKKLTITDISENNPETQYSVYTGSQITKILINETGDEIVSSHGFLGNNCQLWQYKNKSMSRLETFCQTKSRALDVVKGRDSEAYTLVEDGTIRIFSNVFTPTLKKASKPLTIR